MSNEYQVLELNGLECEEAMMLVNRAWRKQHGNGALRMSYASAPFHSLLSKWAAAKELVLVPCIAPVQGQEWVVSVEVGEAHV